MKNRLCKILVLGVIFIFLSIIFAPIINAVSIPKSIITRTEKSAGKGQANYTFYVCKVNVNGILDIYWAPMLGWITEFNGTLYIRSFMAYNEDTGEKSFFDEFLYTGHSLVVLSKFIYRHSSEEHQMEGFAIASFLFNEEWE